MKNIVNMACISGGKRIAGMFNGLTGGIRLVGQAVGNDGCGMGTGVLAVILEDSVSEFIGGNIVCKKLK